MDITDSHFREQLPASCPHSQLRPQYTTNCCPTSFSWLLWMLLQRYLLSNCEASWCSRHLHEAARHRQNFSWWIAACPSCAHNKIQVHASWDLETWSGMVFLMGIIFVLLHICPFNLGSTWGKMFQKAVAERLLKRGSKQKECTQTQHASGSNKWEREIQGSRDAPKHCN